MYSFTNIQLCNRIAWQILITTLTVLFNQNHTIILNNEASAKTSGSWIGQSTTQTYMDTIRVIY